MSTALVVYITAPNKDLALTMARTLVSEKLAACVNLVPQITSIYAWEGVLHEETEVLMLAKTTKHQWESFRQRVKQLHSYEVPEILAVQASDIDTKYLEWLKSSMQGSAW